MEAPGVFETFSDADKLRLSLLARRCVISPPNSPTSLGFDQIQAFPRVMPKPYNVGENAPLNILFFIKVYKLEQLQHIVRIYFFICMLDSILIWPYGHLWPYGQIWECGVSLERAIKL